MHIRLLERYRAIFLLACGSIIACNNPDHMIQPISFESDRFYEQLEPLARSIGDSRIVLLGENGHGVGGFTEAKVKLVEWLYQEHDFDVVVFESGFFECGHVWNRIDTLSSEDALYQCLRYPFQHAELIPLFDLIRAKHNAERPLVLAGMDIQEQGYDSETRPTLLRDVLEPLDPDLADRLVTVDTALFQLTEFGGQGDNVYSWVLEHGDAAKEIYNTAADSTRGWESWVFRLATGWIDRLTVRAEAQAQGNSERPARYYELRDEWMARAVSALADSINGRRKVAVWLHNDHARYGDFSMSSDAHRSVGGYLREDYGQEVYSIGFLMGRGRIADNGRNIREVAAPDPDGIESFLNVTGSPASYLILRGNTETLVQEWASKDRPYLRMGMNPMTLVPADEFDALLYIDHVAPPNYDIR